MQSLSLCSSPLILLLTLVLLCLPQASAAPLPSDQLPQLGLAVRHLQALSDQTPQRDQELDLEPELVNAVEPFPSWDQSDLGSNQDSDPDLYLDWDLVRSERGDLQRDLEEESRLSEALTAVAGGLQAVSREKGGFGFRFGRKRTTVANIDTSQD